MTEFDYTDNALRIEERKADALETIAQKVTDMERYQNIMQDKLTSIAEYQNIMQEKLTLIEQWEKCLCECCRNSSERTEATLQAALNETGDSSSGKDIWNAREDLLRND